MSEYKEKKEVGFVVSAQDYLLRLEGLPSIRINDIIISQNGGRALVQTLDKNVIEALMLDPERPKPGDYFEKSELGLFLPLEYDLFGRAFNPLGVALDGLAPLPPKGTPIDLDQEAPGIGDREIVINQFYTGLTIIDTLIPVGKGQRELMFTEPRSGKESFVLDIIAYQKTENRVCIYNAIGRSAIEIKRFVESIKQVGADSYTIVLAATSDESAPVISISPAVACSVAEHFRNKGREVLLILDDLATHAKYLREITLLSGRIPGRESYPADIFYQHSHLIERAGNFVKKLGGHAITMLPIIETEAENFTNLIPTNIMSMTDGHLLFSSALSATGQYPAIEIDRSVTRVGRQTQIRIHKVLSDKIRSLIADFHEMERFGRFGSELTPQTQKIIKRGAVATELLRQEPGGFIHPMVQILLLTLVFAEFFDTADVEALRAQKIAIIKVLAEHETFKKLAEKIPKMELEDLTKELKEHLSLVEEVCQQPKK